MTKFSEMAELDLNTDSLRTLACSPTSDIMLEISRRTTSCPRGSACASLSEALSPCQRAAADGHALSQAHFGRRLRANPHSIRSIAKITAEKGSDQPLGRDWQKAFFSN
jgi:hypothetical protein